MLPENGDEKGDSDQYLVRTHNAKLITKLWRAALYVHSLFVARL
jgi:hypothetical protein